jgi:lysyl-tRNA synthetase class 2
VTSPATHLAPIERRIQLRRAADAPPVGVGPRIPHLAGLFVALVALINLASALTPSLAGRLAALRSVDAVADIEVAHALALPVGVALLIASRMLGRGSRKAAYVAIALLAAATVLNLAKGLDYEEAAVSFAAAFTLWCFREEFAVTTRTVRPHRVHPVDPVERSAAADVCRRYGTGTLGAFTLRRDVDRLWSADRRAFAAFRIEAGTLLLAGDPVGHPAAHGDVLDEAMSLARAHGLAIGAVGASDAFTLLAASRGLRHLYVGDEALIRTGDVELSGRARKGLRTSMNRVLKHGYTASVHQVGQLDASTLIDLERISALWRDGHEERGFSMGYDRLSDDLVPDALVVVARDADGLVRGFLHFMPVFGAPQVSLAFMRRDRETPNGLSEFLVLRSCALLAERGIDQLSLNFAPFAGLRRNPRHAGERTVVRALLALDRFFHLGGLEGFNDRFDPVWHRRHLVFGSPGTLPRVLAAAMICEGFIPGWPGSSGRLSSALRPESRPTQRRQA